jgi:tetratricopeptide (TPR) repeat protein
MFLPFWLSADSDFNPFRGFSDPLALTGIVFCGLLLWLGFWCIRRREHRPIAFGIFWFFGASAPTSLFVLAEVENDHRMFFPFVGLMLSVTWVLALIVFRYIARYPQRRQRVVFGVQAIAACVLLAYGAGAWERNEVWASESSLWHDVTIKSPENGRGLMNYGLTLMSAGDGQGALDYFQRATAFTPNYYVLEINLGIADGMLNRSQEAEAHFHRALVLAPNEGWPYFYYGRWLESQGRILEAIQNEKSAIEKNPVWMEPRFLLMQIYFDEGQGPALKQLAQDTLNLSPDDPGALNYLARSQNLKDPIPTAEQVAAAQPTPDGYLNLSLLYHRAGRYQDSIEAAKKALSLKPDFPEAYNNIAAAQQSMGHWDEAIQAAQEAIRLKPDFQLAKNNLQWELNQKRLQQGGTGK